MHRARILLWFFGLVAMAACTTRVVSDPVAAVGAQLSVERFLQASNSRDLDAMARLFGTARGPIADTGSTLGCAFKKIGSWFGGTACVKRAEVEIRMDAIAAILQHQDYTIQREEQVAGRSNPTRRVLVDMTVRGRSLTGVPFVVVRSGASQWLVEQVDLARVMAEAP